MQVRCDARLVSCMTFQGRTHANEAGKCKTGKKRQPSGVLHGSLHAVEQHRHFLKTTTKDPPNKVHTNLPRLLSRRFGGRNYGQCCWGHLSDPFNGFQHVPTFSNWVAGCFTHPGAVYLKPFSGLDCRAAEAAQLKALPPKPEEKAKTQLRSVTASQPGAGYIRSNGAPQTKHSLFFLQMTAWMGYVFSWEPFRWTSLTWRFMFFPNHFEKRPRIELRSKMGHTTPKWASLRYSRSSANNQSAASDPSFSQRDLVERHTLHPGSVGTRPLALRQAATAKAPQ